MERVDRHYADAAGGAAPPLIPREMLFGNPDKASPEISPDGSHLAYIAPDQGVLNVWVRTVGREDDRVVTKDRVRGIRFFQWAHNGKHLLYIQDKGGDENWHIYAVNLETNEERNLTPYEGAQALIVATDPRFPDRILASFNNRDEQFHDVHGIDLETGADTLVFENNVGAVGWLVDHYLRLRGYTLPNAEGGAELYVREAGEGGFRRLMAWGAEDALTTTDVGFTPDDRSLYMISSIGSDTAQLRTFDIATGEERVLLSEEGCDVSGVVKHPLEHHVQAVAFTRARTEWQVLDDGVAADFRALRELHGGDFGLINRDHADKTWLVYYTTDDGPVRYYAYDRAARTGTFLFSNRKQLEGLPLAKMEPVQFTSRDGLTLHGYLTLPPRTQGQGLPTVLNVHGGPWHRDTWGYNPEAQWLANRGYACLQVNFRGSTGYGKTFLNAANREWAGKMHDDLVDGVRWAIEQKIADPDRVAIYGGSYGGFASLVGLTFTPELFCCGVDVVGPSNLITFMQTIPPYWKPLEPLIWQRVGHPEKDRKFLESRSPLNRIDKILKPLLIAQGANDPRVKRSESIQMVEALRKAGKEVEYVEYADEGHGFARPENRLDFYGRAEKFLAKYLGGRCEG
jgi:dipeptidyl aminopeptidase/acylaminoacyl peptidase